MSDLFEQKKILETNIQKFITEFECNYDDIEVQNILISRDILNRKKIYIKLIIEI